MAKPKAAKRKKPAPAATLHQKPRLGRLPGTLVHAPHAAGPARVSLFSYSADAVHEQALDTIDESFEFPDKAAVHWINVDGLADVPLLEAVGQRFGLHPLTLEDVLNCSQRPKIEDYGDYEFIVAKSLHLVDDRLEVEQISLFVGKGWILSFQEAAGDSFEPTRERIRKGRGQIRSSGPDHLAYSLLDSLVDEFFPILERFGERLEKIEEELISYPAPDTLQGIYQMKRDLLGLRRVAWPERDLLSALLRESTPIISEQTKIYLRDCYDHLTQVIDIIETYRELAAGMIDVYLSSLSNRMNEVMKVLTIISTIFIPMTFIAGVYGMNFHYMPELAWRYGYPFSLALMAAVAIGLMVYFKKKNWL
jgi:magnesium transporter